MKTHLFPIFKSIIAALIILLTGACSNNKTQKKEQLIIFHAGSLTVPIKEIIKDFNKEHPNVEILAEAAGSRKCARKISDLKKPCDIMASADYTVIDNLLIPEYTDWNIKFATNEMTIVYHPESRYANEINNNNWHNILLREDVAFGRSDPNSDPCGYRAVLTCKLAGKLYSNPKLAKQLLQKDQNYIRPKETDLISLLETNAIDYIFLYRSVAQQHNLNYVVLPDSINLKNTELKDFYKTAKVEISGKKPGETIVKQGEPMVYGITILKNAPNKKMADLFVEFMLNKQKGLAVLESNGQPSIVPSYTNSYDNIPGNLKQFAKASLQ